MFNKTNKIMSLFDKASLVLTPNGYKEGKLYSIKPTDGSGDLDVVRATTATRVNSDGLIEVVPKNLITYSEEFDDASWNKVNITVTANSTTSPSGLIDAETITEDNSYGEHKIDKLTSSVNGVHSIFVKSNGGRFIQIVGAIGSAWYQNFDIINGVLESGNAQSADIIDYGNGWYRIYAYNNSFTAKFQINIIPFGNSSRANNYAGNSTRSYYIWGAQLESGSVATSYFPTTDRLNIPRLDYTNGSCPSILVEPQRTNLLLRSEEFDNAYWVKNDALIIPNYANSPSGFQSADRFTGNSTIGQHFLRNTFIAVSASTNYTYSFYIKTDGISKIGFFEAAQTAQQGAFNLETKSVIYTSSSSSVKIEDSINGFSRVSITTLTGSNGVFGLEIFLLDSLYVNQNPRTYMSNVSDSEGVFIWGAQLEAGSYATSYIPTVSSAVTRNADVINNAGDASTFNDSEGVLMVEGRINNDDGTPNSITLGDGTFSTNRLMFLFSNGVANRVTARFDSSGSDVILNADGYDLTINHKIVLKYKANDIAIWVDGFEVNSGNSFSVPTTLNRIDFYNPFNGGQDNFYGNVKQLQYFPTALNNTDLETLTSWRSFSEMATSQLYTIE